MTVRRLEIGGTRQFDADGKPVVRLTTCGMCGATWDDAIITSRTPVPSARCPFEDEHVYEDDDAR